MGNLSQEKRLRMLNFLNTIKDEHKDDDYVLKAIFEIENELVSKKYGLIWEEHEENVDIQMRTHIPVFTEIKDKEIVEDVVNSNFNFLLEGDNLHSLKLLEKTHKEKVDVIYIDPPYNTGNDGFIYADNIVDINDGYRHSKWLSFMERRLSLAYKLLKDSGIIMISINEIELYNLKLLCDSLFGEDNFLANMIWQSTPGSNTGLDIKTVTEYVLIYAKKKAYSAIGARRVKQDSKYKFQDEHFERRGNYTLNKMDRRMTGSHYSESLNYAIEMPDGSYLFPGGYSEKSSDNWNWRWSKTKVEWGIENGFIVFKKNKGKWAVYFKQYFLVDNNDQLIERSLPFQNLIMEEGINSARGTKEVMDMFQSKIFDYPKPLNLIKHLLSIHSNKDAIILDFFAGSGTTGQAVLELNNEDGGKRKFILCTNNQNDICEKVTYERCKHVIYGYANKDSIPANLKYYKTDFIPKMQEDENQSIADTLLVHIKEMVQLENGINIDNDKYFLVLTDEDADRMEVKWDNYKNCKGLYISKNVLLTASQNKLFSSVDIKTIPDYYFESELREVGEIW